MRDDSHNLALAACAPILMIGIGALLLVKYLLLAGDKIHKLYKRHKLLNQKMDGLIYKYHGTKMDSGGTHFAVFVNPLGTLLYDYKGLMAYFENDTGRDRSFGDTLEGADKALEDLAKLT